MLELTEDVARRLAKHQEKILTDILAFSFQLRGVTVYIRFARWVNGLFEWGVVQSMTPGIAA